MKENIDESTASLPYVFLILALVAGCMDVLVEESTPLFVDCASTLSIDGHSIPSLLVCDQMPSTGDRVTQSIFDCDGIPQLDDKNGSDAVTRYFNTYYSYERDSWLSDLGILLRNSSICEPCSSALRDECYLKLAYALNDSSLCEKLFWQSDRNTCLAVIKNDASICEKNNDSISWGKSSCYYNFALKRNEDVCGLIEDSYLKDFCFSHLGILRKNTSSCDWVESEDYEKVICYAIASNDPLRCSEALKDLECYTDFAVATKKPEMCLYQPVLEYVNDCYLDVAESLDDITICEKIKEGEFVSKYQVQFMRDDCYNTVAVSLLNPDFCGKITGRYKMDRCYLEIAKQLRNPLICTTDECYFEVAVLSSNVSICVQMQGGFYKYEHKSHIILNKDICYQVITKMLNDSTTCGQLEDEYERKTCYDVYEKPLNISF